MSEKVVAKNSSDNVTLASGRNVKLKEMSVDDIDYCNDVAEVVYDEFGDISTVRGVSRARTAWIRRGISGGDFKSFSLDIKGFASDEVLKELSDVERNELLEYIRDYQSLGE